MTLSNNLQGDRYTITILARLCESWPKSINEISCKEITHISAKADYDPFHLHETTLKRTAEWDLCLELLDWLEKEGVLRKNSLGVDRYVIHNMELTLDTLAALRQCDDPLCNDSGLTLFERLKMISPDINSDAEQKLANMLFDVLRKKSINNHL